MKVFCAAFFIQIFAILAKSNAEIVKEFWITQKLDNFNGTDTRTWQMLYMVNDEYFVPNGPIFVAIGGEGGKISNISLTSEFMYKIAKYHKGYMIHSAHRFYGQSKTLEDRSTESFKYLTTQQAIADLAHLIRTIKMEKKELTHSKVILVGFSYSGTLALFFQQMYPELADGYWASGAPVTSRLNLHEYPVVTGDAIRSIGGEKCYKLIENGVAKLDRMVEEKQYTKIEKLFKFCKNFDFNNKYDVMNFFQSIVIKFDVLVKKQNETLPIQNTCKKLLKLENDEVQSLANYMNEDIKDDKNCSNYSYENQIEPYLNTTYDEEEFFRQWYWQSCNEFGYFQTSHDVTKHPFGGRFPLSMAVSICQHLFGEKFTIEYIQERIKKTNEFYGGERMKLKNFFVTYGEHDVWGKVGIRDKRAIILEGHGHCEDAYDLTEKNLPQSQQLKFQIIKVVRTWLKRSTHYMRLSKVFM